MFSSWYYILTANRNKRFDSYLSLNKYIIKNDYRLMVDHSFSTRSVSIQVRLVVKYRVNRLIGKLLSCQGRRCRFNPGLTRSYLNNGKNSKQ